ncbi:MAG: NAD(P)/FAD-dependent oxidoreductase [Granulosicoccaceae bacterium]
MSKSIVVIGGGAGGLELVVKLAKLYKRDSGTDIVLIDSQPSHIWKPLLHEVATGSLNSNVDEISYLSLARKYRFRFVLGRCNRVDKKAKLIHLEQTLDDRGQELFPARAEPFDKLVIAVGSMSNDFGTPGIQQHCLMLDSRQEADRFHRRFVDQLHRVSQSGELQVVIVGGGATGVELAADLYNVARQLPEYGFSENTSQKINVVVVEAGERLLAQLPERVGESVSKELTALGVDVKLNTRIERATDISVITANGEALSSHISVWAAGIKAPAWLAESELEVDSLGRVIVTGHLVVPGENDIYALGDCCACPMSDGGVVPPRAQSAHQMAAYLYSKFKAGTAANEGEAFEYKDLGSLISLSEFSTVGSLMGNLMKGSMFIEGWLARRFYLALYRMHQAAVLGYWKTLLTVVGDVLYRTTHAKLKLH